MRALVFGGRDYADWYRVKFELDRLKPDELIVGGATGADELARQWAVNNRVDHRVCYAKWDQFGKAAGPIRNEYMLSFHPDCGVAFPGGTGTADMMLRLEKAGIPVQVVSE